METTTPFRVRATIRPPQVSELIVNGTAGAAIFLSTLDSGIINVALPSLRSQFHVDVSTISLAVTLYMSVIGTTIVPFGRLADRFGRVAILSVGFALFGLASLLCGCSDSALQLNLFRVWQGLGAAMMQATAAALITTLVVPYRRRAALGTSRQFLGSDRSRGRLSAVYFFQLLVGGHYSG